MLFFSRFNHEFIVSKYRQFREKYSFKHSHIIIVAVIFLLTTGLFFIVLSVYKGVFAQKILINDSLMQASVIVPTEINSNFLTQINECFIPTAAIYGYTLRISSGFRTTEEQDQLYNQGRTVNGHIVTEAPGGKSIHNYGFAVDIVDRWREYNINWEKLAKIGTYCGLEPGDEGDISHFEHRDGITTEDFSAGKRPGPLSLPCYIMRERAKANQTLTLEDLQDCGAPSF